jgi:CHAT domain-containing protein
MRAFYEALGRGLRPARALRAAKRALRSGASPYRKPYYWAAFQVFVGPGPAPHTP